jgi:hypothetical protein
VVTLFEKIAITTEHPKILDIGLVPGKNLIRGLVQDLAEIDPVCCVACGVDGFGPKVVWRFKLHHHCPCRIH